MTKALPKGYTCKCGANHKHPPYVYAHWDMELKHTCETCGRKNMLLRGRVIYGVCQTKS